MGLTIDGNWLSLLKGVLPPTHKLIVYVFQRAIRYD